MNKRLFCTFVIAVGVIKLSAGADPARLDVLNEQRKAAIERAMTQINAKYTRNLEELLKQKTKEGKLDLAVRIREEILLYQKHPTAIDASSSENANPNP